MMGEKDEIRYLQQIGAHVRFLAEHLHRIAASIEEPKFVPIPDDPAASHFRVGAGIR